MDVARDGAADADVAARRQQRLPRRRGLLRLGRAGRPAATTPPGTQAAHDAGVAVLYVHGLNPYGFSWWRRTTHENVDLNRNFRDFARRGAAQRRATTSSPRCWCPRPGRPTRRRVAAIDRFVAEHGAARAAAGDLGRPVPPSATASSSAAARRPGATRRCARCCASTARAARGWPGSTCTPASARAATASASSPAATTPPPTRAPRPGGATSRRSTTARRPRPCSPG